MTVGRMWFGSSRRCINNIYTHTNPLFVGVRPQQQQQERWRKTRLSHSDCRLDVIHGKRYTIKDDDDDDHDDDEYLHNNNGHKPKCAIVMDGYCDSSITYTSPPVSSQLNYINHAHRFIRHHHHHRLSSWSLQRCFSTSSGTRSAKASDNLVQQNHNDDDDGSSDNDTTTTTTTTKNKSSSSSLPTFDLRLQELHDFVQRFGHANVPYRWKENMPLARWVTRMRRHYRDGTISDDQISMIERTVEDASSHTVSFTWTFRDDRWEEGFALLQDYFNTFGNSNVPRTWEHDGGKLGKWVSGQQRSYKNGDMTPERVERLKALHFDFKPKRIRLGWNVQYEELKQFKEKHGHVDVPNAYEPNPQLGHWVKNQRSLYKQNKVRQDRIDALNALNFVWSQRSRPPMRDRLDDLMRYYQRHGHADILTLHRDEPGIARWVQHQRSQWQAGVILPMETIDALTTIMGLDWQVRLTQLWRSRILDLDAWAKDADKNDDDDDEVDKGEEEEEEERYPGLQHWISVQRLLRKKDKLTKKQIDELDKHHFPW